MHKQTLGASIYSGLQKGLHIGSKAVEYTALAKGIYETGQTLFSIGRTVAPMASALLSAGPLGATRLVKPSDVDYILITLHPAACMM